MRDSFLRLGHACALAAAALLLASSAPAFAQNDEGKRVTDSAAVLETLVRAPDQEVPQHILERAEAIVVIPSLVKGGFIVGASTDASLSAQILAYSRAKGLFAGLSLEGPRCASTGTRTRPSTARPSRRTT